MTALPAMPSTSGHIPDSTSNPTTRTHIILLLHGIRDFGGPWMQPAKKILEQDAQAHGEVVQVNPVKFGYYDVLSFLSPFDTTAKPYQKVLRAYESAVRGREDKVWVSIAAHSFGTYLVAKLLIENTETKIHRLFLCGSVLSQDFEWRDVEGRFDDAAIENRDRVRNECGTRDPYPVLAKILNARYGDAGRHGFSDESYAQTFHFDGDHSFFFKEHHLSREWPDYLLRGRNRYGNAVPPKATLLERFTTWPFVTPLLRWGLIVPLWFAAYFWFLSIPLIVLGGWLTYSHFVNREPPFDRGKTIRLAGYFDSIREMRLQADVMKNDQLFKNFVEQETAPDRSRLNFTGAIIEVDAAASEYGIRTLRIKPDSCERIKSSDDLLYIDFREEDLPKDMEYTALQPSGGVYQTAEMVIVITDIEWSGAFKRWQIPAKGVQIKLAKPLTCPDQSTEVAP